MKVHAFHAGDGDSLIVETNDAVLLVDGGRKATFSRHTVPTLMSLAGARKTLDAVCVSHIDADHISGILRLLDDMIARRQFLYRMRNTAIAPGSGPYQPPAINTLWHNGFEAQLGKQSADIADLLGTTSTMLATSSDPTLRAHAGFQRNLALSELQSTKLSLTAAGVLGIPINKDTNGKPLVVEQQPELKLGDSATVKLLGPFQEDLDNLKDKYVAWLERNSAKIADLAEDMRKDRERITDEIDRLAVPLQNASSRLGDRDAVTVPNLASIMVWIEEDGRTCILTGDGHGDDVLKGLEYHGLIEADGGLHVDILKIPHHGSEYNVDLRKVGNSMRSNFLRRITADHYVLCGDGANDNPDKRVVKAIIDSRVGPRSVRSTNAEAGKRFKLWFTTHPDRVDGHEAKHLKGLRSYVGRRRRNRFDHTWLKANSFVI